MKGVLPGSTSGKPIGLAVTKAALRLLGGADFADSIADLTGLSAMKVARLVQDSAQLLQAQSPEEFRDLSRPQDWTPAETLLAESFTRTANHGVPAAALMGVADLLELIVDEHALAELATWTDDERGYFHALAEVVAGLTCRWYLDDPNARAVATAGGVGQVLREQRNQAAGLSRIEKSVTDLRSRSDAQARDAVATAIDATGRGSDLGQPIADWDHLQELGVHTSITIHHETTLTPFIARSHDVLLEDLLMQLRDPGARSALLLVVGTSCTGKTRTLYESVLKVLPDYPVVAPKNDTQLTGLLRGGIPNGTVVWLDEIQRHLTKTADGISAAKAILSLIQSDQVGSILFAGTIWPTNLTALTQRPTPQEAEAGADAILELLQHATNIEVPEAFTAADLNHAREAEDPRLKKAIETATQTSGPGRGRKITQVLSGGTQLANRLHPPTGTSTGHPFTPGARAILHAAGDLIRVGMPNPIPRWALEGAAPGYLHDHYRSRPPDTWLPAALDETTHDANTDDPITGTRTLDIHDKGVPALTPHWTTGPNGEPVDAYDLHDYLYQDHLARHRYTPTRQHLWDTLTSHSHQLAEPERIASAAARDRGLLTAAIGIVRGLADDPELLVFLLANRGDETSLAELRTRADAGDDYAQRMLANLLATRGDEDALTELRTRADTGESYAASSLAEIFADRGDEEALTELRTRADTGDRIAELWLDKFFADRGDEEALTELRTRADTDWPARGEDARFFFGEDNGDSNYIAQEFLAKLLVDRGEDTALTELRTRADAGESSAAYSLAKLLVDRGDDTALTELRTRADAGNSSSQSSLAHILANRGDEDALAELRARADAGDQPAQIRLAKLLARRGDETALTELRAHADADNCQAQQWLGDFLVDRGDETALTELRSRAGAGDWQALIRLDKLLANRGDETSLAELRTRADAGDEYAQGRLAKLLANRGDETSLAELRTLTLAGSSGMYLLSAHRRLSRDRPILELDCDGYPVYGEQR